VAIITVTINEVLLLLFGGLYHFYESYSLDKKCKHIFCFAGFPSSDHDEGDLPSFGEVSTSVYNLNGSYNISAYLEASEEDIAEFVTANNLKQKKEVVPISKDGEALIDELMEEIGEEDTPNPSDSPLPEPPPESPYDDIKTDYMDYHEIEIHDEDILREEADEDEEGPPVVDRTEFEQLITAHIEDGELGPQKWGGLIVGVTGNHLHFSDHTQRIWVKVKSSYANRLHNGDRIILEVDRQIDHVQVLSVVKLEDMTVYSSYVSNDIDDDDYDEAYVS